MIYGDLEFPSPINPLVDVTDGVKVYETYKSLLIFTFLPIYQLKWEFLLLSSADSLSIPISPSASEVMSVGIESRTYYFLGNA